MGTTRVFLPQRALNAWFVAGNVELSAGRLTIKPEGRSYRVVEAVRVVGEVTGASDPYNLVGKVKPVVHVRELGAELLGDSMVLEDNAYDVVFGWVAMPDAAGHSSRHLEALDKSGVQRQSDAEALAQFLARNL